jgi:23S rRNA (cytosine1962-C5)-methyltransferase
MPSFNKYYEESMKKYQVGPETQRMLELGHPWVISDRYTKAWKGGKSGDIVALVNDKQKFLAVALLSPGERIVARILSRQQRQINQNWFEERFRRAQDLRQHIDLSSTNAYRLVNGEGDGLPGITVDYYAGYLMLQFFTSAWDIHQDKIKNAAQSIFTPKGIYRKLRPQETRALEAKKKTKNYSRLIAGVEAPVPLTVEENSLRFLVDMREGLNTGLFPDQRRNRLELMHHVAGKRVLNLFAFTGAFSVAAAAAGAKKVTSVDVSEKYLAVARENFSVNRLNPKVHEFVVSDVFSALEKMRADGRVFDVILFDPPSFSTTKKSLFSTQGGTAKLVAATLPLLAENGLLACSSNHQKISMDEYIKELRKGALLTGCELKILQTFGQSEDFPCLVSFPEGRYLKFVLSVKQH